MSRVPAIRSFASHEWRTYRALRLAALADSPDAFGRTLAEEQELTEERWSSRLSSGAASDLELPLVAELDGEPVGLAWGRIDPSQPGTAHLYQMWVAARARGLGAGRRLLEAVVAWARSAGAQHLLLGVSLDNAPARRLYERAGFEPAGDPEPLRPGSSILTRTMRLRLGNEASEPGPTPSR